MRITRAVITAAGRDQRALPLQRIIDRGGTTRSVLAIIIDEALSSGIDEVCIVVSPGDTAAYAAAAPEHASRLRFIEQPAPRGYGHAVACARDFVGDEPFLHLVGDHLHVSDDARSCAQQLVELAVHEHCAVSAVQASREHLLPYYGVIGGRRIAGRRDRYLVEEVIEKPTPTEAEGRLAVPGLRAGHYLCFFGMHVLTPAVMHILEAMVADAPDDARIQLSPALSRLAAQERLLALEVIGARYDVGVRYGLLNAQLALALGGPDRAEVLAMLVELLAQRR
jgi:UTP--glucose-1-phosphate uridylyltransferase